MAAEFVATLIALGISLFPSLGAYAFSSFFSNNSYARKRRVAEEDPERPFQTVELIQATLYDAEQTEIKDPSFKLWLKKLRNIAREAEDLLHEYQYVERCVRTKTRRMQYIVPLPDGILVSLNQLRNTFEKIERERQDLRFSESNEEGHVADKKHMIYLQAGKDEHWDIYELQGKKIDEHSDINLFEWSESDEKGDIADEEGHVADEIELQAGNSEHWDINLFKLGESDEKGDIADEEEIEGQRVLQETERDEVECDAEESEIIECEADLQLSKRDEVGYPSEETEIKEDEAPQLTKCDEVGHAAENRDIRDLSELMRRRSKANGFFEKPRVMRWSVINLFEWSESDEKGSIADEEEIEGQRVLQETESDEVESDAEENEIIECEADLQLSKRDEVGYPSEEMEIKEDEAPQLTKCDKVGHAAENRDIRDHSELKRVAYNAEDVHRKRQIGLFYSMPRIHVKPFQLNSNLSRERLNVLNDGTTEHFERLMSYAEGSFAFICTLVLTMFMSSLMEKGNPIFIRATQICFSFSVLSNLVVKKLSEDAHTLSRSGFRHQCKHVYIFIYGSTFMLMLCGLCFLLLSNANYGPLGIFPALALIIMIGLFLRGYESGHTQAATNYREHDGKLKYYYEFSSACTMATFVGLLTYISSSPTPHQNGEVRLTEIALYIGAVTSLLLRQLTTVPPAVSDDNMRARVMEAMRYLSYIIVGLLFSVALLATGAVLRGVISILIYVAGTMIFLVVVVMNELKVNAINTPGEHIEPALHAIGVADFTFGALLSVYSKYINCSTKVDGHYFLLLLCMVCLCSAFIMSLSKALLVSDGTTPAPRPRFNMIPSCTSYAVRCIAVIALLLL